MKLVFADVEVSLLINVCDRENAGQKVMLDHFHSSLTFCVRLRLE